MDAEKKLSLSAAGELSYTELCSWEQDGNPVVGTSKICLDNLVLADRCTGLLLHLL